MAVPKRQVSKRNLLDEFEAEAEALNLKVEVFSDGPTDAQIAVVGEGPGEQEVRHPQRVPFVGGAGNLLWRGLNKYGMHRGNVYVTNVVKRQISLSRKGGERHIVHRDELDKWIGMLNWELSQLPSIRYVLILGNYALEALTSLDGILKWRGSVLDAELPNGNYGKVVCTINPAYAQREDGYRLEPFFLMDCQKLDLVSRHKFQEYKIDEIINPTYGEARAFIRDLQKSPKPVSFDVEAINNEVACYGLANDAHRAMCINLRDAYHNRYTTSQEVDILLDLQKLCDSHRMVGQNGPFDAYFTRLRSYLRVVFWYDTLLAHHTLFPKLPHNLGFLCTQYTTHPFYKDEGKDWKEGGDIDNYWRYNCKDAAITYRVMERTHAELKQTGMEDFFFNHVMRAQKHLVESTVHGVAVDASVRGVITEVVNQDVASKEREFERLVKECTGDDSYLVNPRSWEQLQHLFFEVMKLKGKGKSTDETNRNHIMQEASTPPIAREMLASLTAYKKEDKFRSTYLQSRESEDKRMRCDYKQYGVSNAPGRLSSAELIPSGDGGNMQNIPVRARGMYIADPGCVFIYFDLSQAESQVVSFRADIPKWKAQYAKAKVDKEYDAHRALASEMFKVPYDKVPKEDWNEQGSPTIRYIGKRCRHALNYRMERHRLAEVTELPYHQAAHAFTVYHTVTPELRPWWAEEERLFKRDHCIYNALGRRFYVLQRLDDATLRSIIAFYPQSTIGDKVVQVWYQCHEDDEWPTGRARIAIDVHDNLVGIAEPKVAKTCLKIMKKYAESPIMIQDVYKRRKHEPLSIPAECKMSYPSSWDEKRKTFVLDRKGLHRWSNLEKVEV